MAVFTTLSRSLKFRLTGVVVLLVLTATLIVALMALVLAERDMKSIIGNQQYALLSSAAAQIDAQIKARQVLLASLANTIPLSAATDPAAMQAFVDSHPVARKQFFDLHIFNRRGDLLHMEGDHVAATVALHPRSRRFLEDALAAGRPVITPPYKSAASGLPSIMFLQPVLDAQRRTVMLLGGSIDLTKSGFLEQVSMQKPGKTGFIYIMTRDGLLVHHPDRQRLLDNINARPGYNRATEMALQGYQGWTEAANKDGSEGIYSYKHLQTTGWILGARFPVDEAFEPMIVMRQHAMLAATVFAAGAGLVAWLAIQLLLKPLGRLHRNIGDIRSGAADIGVLQGRRCDEIGELSSAFHDLMAERVRHARQIAASEKRLKLLTDNLPVLIAYLDHERKFQFLNATFQQWFGIDPPTLIGRQLRLGIGSAQYRTAQPHLERAYRGDIVTYELKARINDCLRTLETTLVPELAADGKVVGIYSLTHDTTHIKEIEQRLKQLARIDTLTGIPNRLMFEEILQLAIVRSRRNRRPLALAYLDIDNFKEINDTRGHGAGDMVLKEFAARLVAAVRAADSVARLAGDEFVIVFEQVANAEEAARLAAKIVEAVRLPFTRQDAPRHVTTSIGVAVHEGDDESPAQLVARADSALYAAKRNGRDGYVIAD